MAELESIMTSLSQPIRGICEISTNRQELRGVVIDDLDMILSEVQPLHPSDNIDAFGKDMRKAH